MESQPQNPEFKNNPENFHPCMYRISGLNLVKSVYQNCFSYFSTKTYVVGTQ